MTPKRVIFIYSRDKKAKKIEARKYIIRLLEEFDLLLNVLINIIRYLHALESVVHNILTIRTRLKSKHMDAVARERAGLPAADQHDDQDGGESSVDDQPEPVHADDQTEPVHADARSDVSARMKAACFDYCRAADKFAVLAVLTAFWDDGCDDDLAVDVGRRVFMDSPAIAILDAFLRARRDRGPM
jgi:hypothetical protein